MTDSGESQAGGSHVSGCHTGGCVCGAVRFQAEGEPVNIRACHCRLCQLTMGAPFFARALFSQADVEVSGPTSEHNSSNALSRVFCSKCGSTLFARRANGTFMGIALTAFDERNIFEPTEHIWITEKVTWLKLDDGLPQHPEKAPD